jgi:hypothetical protein
MFWTPLTRTEAPRKAGLPIREQRVRWHSSNEIAHPSGLSLRLSIADSCLRPEQFNRRCSNSVRLMCNLYTLLSILVSDKNIDANGYTAIGY